MKKLLALFVVVLGFTAVSFGQTNTATSNASANILGALKIENKVELNFGTVGAKTVATIVKMAVDGSRAGSTADLVAIGLGAAGEFDINGNPSATFSLTLPTGVTLLKKAGGADMSINAADWVTDLGGTTGTLDAVGYLKLKVGATLQVNANQSTGAYTGPFDVTVNYN